MTWNATWLRLGLLLACMAAALVALVDQRGILWASGGSAQAGVVHGCAGRLAPQTALLGGVGRAQLRDAVLAASPAQAAGPYEQGAVGTPNLWSDNNPRPGAGGGYEARWWALDAEGRLDDVVVDVLRYASASQAQQALLAAADPRCHRRGKAAAAALPAGARLLGWQNPDNAWQQDTLFARAALLYRVSDAPPGVGAAEVVQQAREGDRASAVTQALACLLPRADCPQAPLAALEARAGTPAPVVDGASPTWPRTAAQGSAYVQAVSLHAYDVPYMSALRPAIRAPLPEPALLGHCAHVPVTGTAIGARSPLFAVREGLSRWTAQSSATLLASEGAAASYVAAVRRALAGPCAKRFYTEAVARSQRSHPHARLDFALRPLALTAPQSYRRDWPYRPVGERLSLQAILTTHRQRRLRRFYVADLVVFAYRRALVELSVTTSGAPFPEANLRYLESVLVGRAEARWGASSTG